MGHNEYRYARFKAKVQKRYYLFQYRFSRIAAFIQRHPLLGRLKRRHYAGFGFILLSAVLLLAWLVVPPVKAATVSLTSNDLLNGKSDFNQTQLTNNNTSLSLQKGDIGQWSDSTGTQINPILMGNDTDLVYGPNNTVYMLTNMDSCRLMRFATETQEWEEMTAPPVGCGTGQQIVYDGAGSLYYLAGNNATVLFRYDIDSDSWTQLADMQAQVSSRASMVFVGSGNNSALYLTRGGSSASFWKYNIQTNTWISRASFPSTRSVDLGIALVWDTSNNIYALSNHFAEFKRYSIATDSWTNLTAPENSLKLNKMMWVNGTIYDVELKYAGTPDQDSSYMVKYTPGTDSWSSLERPPMGQAYDYTPAATYDGNDSIYTMMGAYQRTNIYRYSISQGKWYGNSLFKLNDATQVHYELMYDGAGSAYYLGGRDYGILDRVYKYDLATKTYAQIGGQFSSNSGVTGAYRNGYLYLMPYYGGLDFERYEVATGTSTRMADLPLTGADGTDLIDGGDGFLYAVLGGRADFYRYSEGGGWVKMANMPQAMGGGGGITRIGRTIYVLSGNTTSGFVKYNMDTNIWTTATELPSGGVSFGGLLTGDGSRYLYASLGTRTDPQNHYFYQFDTVNTTWKRIANTPQDTNVGATGFYDTTNNRLFVTQGIPYSSIWSWTSTATSYVTTGNWYSKTLDLKGPQSWQSLQSTITGTGTATFYTRTSAKGGLWTDWQQVTGTTINSPLKRYVQIKVTLAGSGAASPVVSNIALTYGEDTVAPTLPSQLIAKSSATGTDLTSGQTYVHQHPYFSWSGSGDGSTGSGVAGYYVYFGTDSNADPVAQGNFQTSSSYTTTTAMTAGSVYYLRIKAKDNKANVSDAATYFSYRYFYISPPGSVLQTSKQDFSGGINTGVNITDDGSMGLVQQPKGVWATGTMQMLPASSTAGGAQVVIDDYLYVLRGSSTNEFWRYNLVTQVWETLVSAPATIAAGSAMTWDKGNYIYANRGTSANGFYRYNIQTNSWETLTNLPAFANPGTDIKYIGNNKIAIQFSGFAEFYFYDTNAATFESRTPAPLTIQSSNAGSGLWYDGADTLYGYFGGYDQNQHNRNALLAYSISQDVWRPMAQPSMNAIYPENNLVGDGHGHLYIFANDYVSGQSHKAMAAQYDIASDTWKLLPNATALNIRGTLASDGKRYIYEIPGFNNSRRIMRYDTWDDRFTPQETAGIASWQRVTWDHQSAWNWVAGQATSAVYDGTDSMYALGAHEGSWGRFIKYSISEGTTKYMPPPPSMGIGGSLSYMGGNLYYLPARSTTTFYKFDMNNQNWVKMANLPVIAYRPGANSLMAVGNNLYAFIGNSGRQLYKFVPDSGVGTWTRMTDVPGNVLQGAVTFDGANSLYVLAGSNTTSFYKYNISGNSWSTMAAIPAAVSTNGGGAAVFNNGKIYASVGNTTTTTYVYDVAANSWQTGASAPDTFRFGAVYVPITSDYALVLSGDNSPDVWRFNFPGTNAAYSGLATHISQPMSIDGLFDYAGIKAQVTVPDHTKIEFWTRTSADGISWDEWTIGDQAKYYNGEMSVHVASRAQKFTQVKAILYSFDNQSTPTIDSYAVDYYYDTSPPSNPTLFDAYQDSTKQAVLSGNVWYNDSTPYFDWPDPGEVGGATDGPLGSNIKGYWVYAGTDPTAQPQTAGVFVTGSDYAPTLTAPGTYYVRLQAVDVTGNVDGAVFSPFIYKFDNVPPTAPALITVTPSGFTSTNNYTFQWPNSFDANSGVAAYCYHTGALSGAFANEICEDTLELEDISAAYRPGTNVFYLRTKDVAGNFSSSYTTVSYYYSTDPPSPVTSLRAVPPVSAQNLFAFTWDLPVLFAGDPDQLSYCYAVNELPSPTNTTCTTDRFIGAFKAATQQGTNILYMVAKDEAGTVNWNNYASANFIANTVSPGIPLNLVVSDNSDRLSGRWALTLTWDKPTFEGNGITHYVIERSEDDHTYTEIGQVSNNAYVDLTVQPEVKYYYRIRAADNVDNRGGPSAIVAGTAKGNYTSAPQIVAEPKVQSSFDQATITWVTARASTSFVYYGTSPTQMTQSKGSLDLVSEHAVTITGLQPSTNYYFKVQSFDNDRGYDLSTAFSQFYTFRTSANARIFNVATTDLTLDSAIINWQTSVPTKARIQYGTSTDYGFTQDDSGGASTNHIFKLTGLTSGTMYHYRIVATTEYGSQVTSDDYTVKTIARPVVSNVRFQPLPDDLSIAVKVSWTTNVPTSSDITYRGLGTQQKSSAGDLVIEHEMIIADLAGNTDYRFDIQGRDQYGNLASSDNQLWKTSVDTRPPAISNMSVNVSAMESSTGKAQLIISWKTDEPSTTQLQYGDGTAKRLTKKTPFDPEPTVNHVVVVSSLDMAKVYRIQPVSRDISGNTSYGSQLATVTPDREQSPLDAVLNTLQRIFRF